MPRSIRSLEVDAEALSQLRQIVRRPSAAVRAMRRAQIILCRAAGQSQQETARKVGVTRVVVGQWERRFSQAGMAGLEDKKGRGRKPSVSVAARQMILTRVTQPPPGQTRWSVRSMARAAGVSPRTVHDLWRANDLKPHLTRTFKLSCDPQFEPKFWDVIGLYLDPPQKALVLCCDEPSAARQPAHFPPKKERGQKSQCQALERTQPGLPLGIGHIRTRTHDYVRHGTITLFAALNYLDGKILSRTAARHTHREWLDFLRHLDRETPAELTLHLIIDNYATHKHPKVRAWLEKHPRLVLHFTPTGSSWLNLVERFFRDLTVEAVREGSFASVRELVTVIETYLAQRNLSPKPYRWRKRGEEILAKILAARTAATALK